MNSFFARTTLLGLSLIASMASAKPFQSQDIIKAEFSTKKSTRYVSAFATLNYGNHTLDITLQPKMPVCPRGMMCAQVTPEPVEYSFGTVKSTVDHCGVITSKAFVNQLPVDGVYMEVILRDNSANRCADKTPVAATLNVKQKWYDRLQGKYVQTADRFISEIVDVEIPFQGVIRADLESVTSQAFIGGSIYLDGRNNFVELTLEPVMPECPKDMACAQVMPEPVTYSFENAKTEIDGCGIIRTVASFDDRPVDGIFMKVTISNNGNNTCPTFAPLNALDVVVEKAHYSRLEAKYVETVDLLKADDIALIKPGK